MSNFERAPNQGALGPCFSLSDSKLTSVPRMSFAFQGNATMDFPITNYLLYDDKEKVLCLSLTTNDIYTKSPNVGLSGGPNILINWRLSANGILFGFRSETEFVGIQARKLRLRWYPGSCKNSTR